MNEPADRDRQGAAAAELEPLDIVDVCSLHGIPIPEREWLWNQWFPLRAAGALYGDGGWAKTIFMMQLATCFAAGLKFVGHEVRRCKALLVLCEDELHELHRRQADICSALGIDFGDLAPEALQWIPRAGKDNLMVTFDSRGRMEPTPFFAQVMEQAVDTGVQFVVLDSAKDIYGGQENDRAMVTQFGALLTRLALKINGHVELLAHPSLSGRSTGTGESGSTSWDATFRVRSYGTRPQVEEGATADDSLRILSRVKCNYAARGASLQLRLVEGAFVPLRALAVDGDAKAALERLVLQGLLELAQKDHRCSLYKGQGNFAPKALQTYSNVCTGQSTKDLQAALARLIKRGRIKNVTEGPPSRRRSHLIVVDPEFQLQ